MARLLLHLLRTTILLSLICCSQFASQAQNTTKPLSPWSLRFGFLRRTASTDDIGLAIPPTYANLCLNYDFHKSKNKIPFVFSAYGDYFFGATNSDENPTASQSGGGIGIAGRALLQDPGASPVVSLGLGSGLYKVGYKASFNIDYDILDSHSTVGLGGKLFGGLEWTGGFLIEVGYYLLPETGGLKGSGFYGQMGSRF